MRGAEPHEAIKNLENIERFRVKFQNTIISQNFEDVFCTELVKTTGIRIYENSIGVRGAEPPPEACKILRDFPDIPITTLILSSKFAGRDPELKLTNAILGG